MTRMPRLSALAVAVLLLNAPAHAQTKSPDFDNNGRVDFDDFFLFAAAFGGSEARFDLNNNGRVDFDDFFLFAADFGKTAQPGGQPTAGKVVATIPLKYSFSFVSSGLITPDGKSLYAMGCDSNTVSVIDIPSHKVVKTIAMGKAFKDTEDLECRMAATPDGRYVYINYNQTDAVSVVETSSHQLIKVIAAGNGPAAISIAPDGKFAYVPNVDPVEGISLINTSSREVVKTISLSDRGLCGYW